MIEPFWLLFSVNVRSDKVSVLSELTLNIAYVLSPEIAKTDSPGPVMVKSFVIPGKSEVRVMVPLTPESNTMLLIVDEAFAEMIADLKDPALPSSRVFVTEYVVGEHTPSWRSRLPGELLKTPT
jgi:hypothetical protein